MQELSKSNAKNHGAQDVTEVTPPNSASHSTSGSDKKPKRHWLQLFTLWKNPDDAADALMVDADPKYAQQIRFWATFILWTSIVFVVIAFFWAKYSKLDETTRGEGRVIPASQVQVIQNLEGGIVKKILVREGEIVHSAQPLLQIDDVLAEARYQEAQNKILSLEARSLRLKAITQNQPLIIPTSLQEKVPDLVGYQQDLYDAQQKELGQMRTTYSIIHKEYQFTKPLVAKGAAAPVEVLRLERDRKSVV